MLASALPPNDNDSEYLFVPGSNVRVAKCDYIFDMVMSAAGFRVYDRVLRTHLSTRRLLFYRDMGLDMFRQHIILNNLVQSRIVDGLLMLIEKERLGDTVDRLLLKSLLRMLCDLQLYSTIFETK